MNYEIRFNTKVGAWSLYCEGIAIFTHSDLLECVNALADYIIAWGEPNESYVM